MVNVDGSRKPIRTRLHAVAALAGFALLVGLAAPASALAESSTRQTDTTANAAVGAPAVTHTPAAPAPPAPPAAPKPPAAPAPAAPAAAAPTNEQLHPVAEVGAQQQFTPSVEQMSNAKAIVETGKAMGLPPRAWTIAVSTALQESNLKNLGDLGANNDYDSLGLFQQRPSSGWGSPEQVQNPTYAATAFYKALVRVDGWQGVPLTVAAQKVQVSAYPDHYAKHEAQAGDMIEALYGAGPFASVAASLK